MERSSVQLVIGVMLGLVGSLSGIWLTSYLGRGDEELKWRRDKALEAYTEVLRSADVVLVEALAAYNTEECGTETHVKHRDVILDKVVEMYRASDRASLLGPSELNHTLAELVIYCGKELGQKFSACPKLAVEEHDKMENEYARLYVKFTNDARNDLGVHEPLHKPAEWRELGRTKP